MKHIELMRKYMQLVEEGNKEPWEHFEKYLPNIQEWITMQPYHWFTSDGDEFRRKQCTININGYIIPEPIRTPPELGTIVYLVSPLRPTLVEDYLWDGEGYYLQPLARGLFHYTRESARIHAKALLSFTKEPTSNA